MLGQIAMMAASGATQTIADLDGLAGMFWWRLTDNASLTFQSGTDVNGVADQFSTNIDLGWSGVPVAMTDYPIQAASADINGRKSVTNFGGSDSWLSYTDQSVFTPIHNGTEVWITAVVFIDGANPDDRAVIMGTADGTARTGFAIIYDDRSSSSRNNAIVVTVDNSTASRPVVVVINNSDLTPNAWHILTVRFDANNATAANRCTVWVDGVDQGAANSNTAAPSASGANWDFALGGFGETTAGGTSRLADVVGYDADHREMVEAELASYNGITI